DARAQHAVTVRRSADGFVAGTGIVECTVPSRGPVLVTAIRRAGRDIACNVRLVALRDDQPEGSTRRTEFVSELEKATLEQEGPVRSVIRLEGRHRDQTRAWLPFTVRLYLYAGAESIRIMHTFVFDGDEQQDFIRGIGLTFDVPLRDAPHDRHVRFAGEDGGLWA
ncbi:Tat pathway signal sequence domain protein, partial [Massilia sp. CT11-108]